MFITCVLTGCSSLCFIAFASILADPDALPLNPPYLNISAADKTYLLVLSGAVMGLLPLLQAHSFFGVGIVTVTVALMEVRPSVLVRSAGLLGSSPAHLPHACGLLLCAYA